MLFKVKDAEVLEELEKFFLDFMILETISFRMCM